jgi:hypothetical protein
VQHLPTGVSAFVVGWIITEAADKTLLHFDAAGLIAAAMTLLSRWLAGRLRPAGPSPSVSAAFRLDAADESLGAAGDPLPAAESV